MLEIRAMQAEDLEAVVRTESQIFSRPWSRKGFEDALRQKETIYLVAYEKDILAGYCGLLQSFDEADITNVAVVEKFRKKGVATELLEQLFLRGYERGSYFRHGPRAAGRRRRARGALGAGRSLPPPGRH